MTPRCGLLRLYVPRRYLLRQYLLGFTYYGFTYYGFLLTIAILARARLPGFYLLWIYLLWFYLLWQYSPWIYLLWSYHSTRSALLMAILMMGVPGRIVHAWASTHGCSVQRIRLQARTIECVDVSLLEIGARSQLQHGQTPGPVGGPAAAEPAAHGSGRAPLGCGGLAHGGPSGLQSTAAAPRCPGAASPRRRPKVACSEQLAPPSSTLPSLPDLHTCARPPI